MANFKVGRRVRLLYALGNYAGREATVLSDLTTGRDQRDGSLFMGHIISIDGVGDRCPRTYHIFCAPPDWLAPLTPPDTWAADKVKQVTKPQHLEPVAPHPLQAEWNRILNAG